MVDELFKGRWEALTLSWTLLLMTAQRSGKMVNMWRLDVWSWEVAALLCWNRLKVYWTDVDVMIQFKKRVFGQEGFENIALEVCLMDT